MFSELFGNKYVEKIIFFLLKNNKCYAMQLSKIFGVSLSPIQKTLEKLEKAAILVSILEGKTRIYIFNPRYLFYKELKALFIKAYEFIPKEHKNKYYEPKIRRRPRRKGKLL